ncbi:Krueppel homolog 2-like [Pollicipes pollicipes]|uniref:Krueppel homolog 2-like n=1 Tax=Pollicipes pollicipes TaxID=41117 RepID=UPI001884D8CF|nr:Krueppel homolog 2-like [Pollicipes pollicipes]XP_037086255.1 Krueppel homolog 2-like [Pollicipes pollicipes]XP_037088461.1 Krueppel homolog 2-like [Pollicipes pollicipes]XP_037088462.1 Krueppel homolog 2-like [Pollicipes pollicipes]
MDATAEDSSEGARPSDQPGGRPAGIEGVREHIVQNKVSFALFCTRLAQVLFAIGYLLPIFGSAANAYSKALVATVATSALRLHQRVPQLQMSRQFLATLMAEDACHYLLFALVFLYGAPMTMVLVPPTLFAVLHSASYGLRLLDLAGQNNSLGARYLISLVELQSQNILRAVALSEIVLMPYTVFMLFTGRGSLLVPFLYYRFLSLRYSSHRNPYSRNMFHELRRLAEAQAASPGCPAFLATLIRRGVGLVVSLSPPAVAAH